MGCSSSKIPMTVALWVTRVGIEGWKLLVHCRISGNRSKKLLNSHNSGAQQLDLWQGWLILASLQPIPFQRNPWKRWGKHRAWYLHLTSLPRLVYLIGESRMILCLDTSGYIVKCIVYSKQYIIYSKDISLKSKLCIYNSNVKATLLYGSETWRVTRAIMHQLQAFVNKCLCYIRKIWWVDKISKQCLWNSTH